MDGFYNRNWTEITEQSDKFLLDLEFTWDTPIISSTWRSKSDETVWTDFITIFSHFWWTTTHHDATFLVYTWRYLTMRYDTMIRKCRRIFIKIAFSVSHNVMRVRAENHNVSYHWHNGIFCLYDSFEIEIKLIKLYCNL